MKNVLQITPVILFAMENNESQKEAEQRFLQILKGEGFDVISCTSKIAEESNNEKV